MNKPQILIVEDDAAVGNLIATTLETQNYQYHRAKSGAGAIMDALSYRPDVMLLDLGLPDIKSVQDMLGHATASFTLNVYAHTSDQMKKDTAARMQTYYNNLAAKQA